LNEPALSGEQDITEEQAIETLAEAVDTSGVIREGEGSGVVYAYGYRCAPDRLKIGLTESDTVQRIAAQIATSTPDKPVLLLEIRTNTCRALERAIHGALETRGQKIVGGGAEWFRSTRDEVLAIYKFINQRA
jgi:T5orf172 domain-containing protein